MSCGSTPIVIKDQRTSMDFQKVCGLSVCLIWGFFFNLQLQKKPDLGARSELFHMHADVGLTSLTSVTKMGTVKGGTKNSID